MTIAGFAVVAITLSPVAASFADPAPAVLTEVGVGRLRLGRPLAAIRADHLVGRVSAGCELASPRPVVAKLVAPLKGFATFSGTGPAKRLVSLSVTGGARTTRGVTVGTTAARVRRAYPRARVEHSPAPNPLQFDAIVVTRADQDRIWFMLDRKDGRVQSIDVPGPEFCE